MTHVILVRHGETVWHDGNRYAGRTDVALTPRGRLQAAELAAWAAGQSIDAVFSSPLSRARLTAAPAGEALGLTPRVDERLSEAQLRRIFALLRGTFDVRTNFGKLAAISTQFEVDATPGSAKVVQIEGEIQVSQEGAAAGPRVRPLEQLNLSVPAQKPTALAAGECAAVTATHSNVVQGARGYGVFRM